MFHSVNYGDKNTWEDWKLVPTSRPLFTPPGLKTKYVDIPGRDGKLDLTEVERGYPLYNNRTGSHEFIVVNDFYEPVDNSEEWYVRYSKIMNYLQGKKLRAVLEDDPEYYYEGRFSVNAWKSDKQYSKITINYDVGPYKWSKYRSDNRWEWDPFNFQNGVITLGQFEARIQDTNTHTLQYEQRLYGYAPVVPKIVIRDDLAAVGGSQMTGLQIDWTNGTGSTRTKVIPYSEIYTGFSKAINEFIFVGEETSIELKVLSDTTNPNIDVGFELLFYRGSF